MAFGRLNQGVFKPNNPSKYRGDVRRIVYRSGYELTFMMWCDKTEGVVEWNSEEVIVPYRTILDEEREMRTGKPVYHRYFVDFYVKVKNVDGTLDKYLIEVKPLHETVPPVVTPGKKRRTVLNEQRTWIINSAKWDAAREFCRKREMKFKIVTEVELYGRRPGKN